MEIRFGELVRSVREARGLSQEELADRVSMDRSQWTKLEGTTQNPTMATREKAAKALGMTLDGLVSEGTRLIAENPLRVDREEFSADDALRRMENLVRSVRWTPKRVRDAQKMLSRFVSEG